MVFSSLTFLLIFLPGLTITYFIIPKKYRFARNIVLLIWSVLFYAWGEPKFVFLILFSLLVTWGSSFWVVKKKKWALLVGVLVNLLPLVIYKYLDFFIDNINLIPGLEIPLTNLIMPIGISFYTFQILTYVIDLYYGKVGLQKNPLYVALYIFLFPQLIAGPIVRYSTVEDDIENRNENWEDVYQGLRRFAVGLAKKVLIANQAGLATRTILAEDADMIGSGMMWLCVFAYAVQIYFDFSGYSDMAIGMGRIFGFRFLENFEHPYISKSITEFWRRWHISLSTFFRDYVYIPLGGNRVSTGRWLFNIMLTWFLTGFWHGAFWNYILWGLYYGVLLVLEKFVLGKLLRKIPAILQWLYTFFFTLVGWAIFMTETNRISELGAVFKKLFFASPVESSLTVKSLELQPALLFIIIGFIASFPWAEIFKFKGRENKLMLWVYDTGSVALYLASLVFLIAESFNPFIYFRF